MTAPVEASATTVQPSATMLEDAEIAVIEAAISDTSAKLIEGLVEVRADYLSHVLMGILLGHY
jgi:hypothetical protein